MPNSDARTVKNVLEDLRDNPADTTRASDAILQQVYLYLMQVPHSDTGEIHWFCKLAVPTTVEAATFLIRLMAYQSDEVKKWKSKLHQCLSTCISCVQGLESAKVASQDTYLAAFPKESLKEFFTVFENWELEEVLKDAGLASNPTPNQPHKPLSETVLYRILSNWTLFCNAQVLAYLESHPPTNLQNSWADLPFPPGILVLLVARNAEVRTWASKYALRIQHLEPNLFIGSYLKALEVVHAALQLLQSENPKLSLASSPSASRTVPPLEFAKPSEFWPGFNIILRLIPPNYLKSNSPQPLALRRDIFSQLRDNNSHFNGVFKCFTLLLKRLANDLWNEESPEYPKMIFETIICNPSYIALLHDSTSTYVAWIQEYLSTTRSFSTYTAILEKTVNFLFSEAELERSYKDAPALLKVSMNILHSDLRRLGSDCSASHLRDFQKILDLHATTILSVAHTNHYIHGEWSSARHSARCIVEEALSRDVTHVKEAIITLSHILGQHKQKVVCEPLPSLSIREGMWNTLLSTIQPEDTVAIAEIVCIVGKIAHLSFVRTSVFSTQWKFPEGDETLNEVNKSLATIQSGFSSLICSVSDSGISAHPLDILQHAGVGNAVVKLLLSPCPEIQTAGKTLAGLAFDVDGRMDCFRAMLENLPGPTFDGMFEFFDNFRQCALSMPEACDLSATLVLCFADILEVLCSSPDGLLLNTHFRSPADDKGPAARIPQFWKLLTEALSVIYRRTPMWAEHVEIPKMVIWMRDALILARDVLKQRMIIENAANTYVKVPAQSSTRKLSPIGRQMVEALQDFLPELVRWLRLTDEELLHQSFSLLQSLLDLMRETHVRPAATALGKLAKYVAGKSGAKEQTRLDSGRLLQLSEALAHFDPGGSDEVEIVSRTQSTTAPVLEVSQAKIGVHRSHTQEKGQQLAPKRLSTAPTVPSRPGPSQFFSNRDQQRLESVTSMPSFRKPGSSTPVPPNQKPPEISQLRGQTGALRQLASSEESGSSSDSGEDDAAAQGLANLGRFPKSPKKPRPVERRQIKTLDIPTQSNSMQNRMLRNKQPKINGALRRPEVSGLHKILLSWNYNHDGPTPPGEQIKLFTVPNRFDSYEHYFRVFQPLLLMECWAQLLQSKDEKQDSYQCKVDSRQYVDDWLDIDLTIAESVKKDWYLAETDIVLLRQPGHDKSIMAKIKFYKASMSGIQATIRCYVQAGAVDPGLQITTLWQISKIFSLSTLHREYGALLSLQHNDLLHFILRPTLPLAPRVDTKELQETMDAYKVNEPQATAILKSLNTAGFSLIQGPPGTGKTSTICGLISRFLSKRPRAAVPIIVGSTAASSRRQEEAGPTARVLLCAPSNAAIDELAQRLKDGYVGSEIRANPLNLVRIGADQAISSGVRDISLDYLVDQKLDGAPKPFSDIGNEIKTIRRELEKIKNDRNTKFEEMTKLPDKGPQKVTLDNEVKFLNSRRQALMSKLDQQKDQQRSESRTMDALRRNTRHEVLNKADIICCTLSGSGHESLENLEFDMVVIDEAAQAIELSSLIPLKYLSSRCVMVGDPQQLPPTVISQEATRYSYNQSLFVRLQQSRKEAVHLLSIQYRMHPDISCLPSRVFYDNKLIDGPSMADKTKQPWHAHEKFGTYKFLNISWGIEEPSGRSIKNSAECNVAVELFKLLRHEFSSVDFNFRIGIVSMYKAQINALRRLFIERFGNDIGSRIDFNTVDGFQGQEKDVIILSCVRAGPGLTKVGFLSDIRRMNVALTRAKSSLFILGNVATLERSDNTWHQIINDARSRSALVNINSTYFARSAEVTAPPPKKKHRSTAPFSIPPTLYTPHEIGASTSIPKVSTITQSQETDGKADGVILKNPSADDPARGTKRSAETSEAGPPSSNKHPRISDNTSNAVDPLNGTSRASDIPSREAGSSSYDKHGTTTDTTAGGSSNKRPQKSDQQKKRPKQQTMFIPKKRT